MNVHNTPLEGGLPLDQLAAPAQRALAGAGYSQLEDLTKVTESQLKQLHGIGPKALRALRSALEAQGLSFAGEKG
jgi:hypothetical protein